MQNQPPVDSVQLPKKSGEKTIVYDVYGRYKELVNGGGFMVYKPTNISGRPHPVPTGAGFFHRMYSWVSIHLSWGCSINLSGYITIILPSGKLT